jgi:hypothetical protein
LCEAGTVPLTPLQVSFGSWRRDRPKPWEVNLLPLLPAAVVPPVHGEAVYLGGLASVSAAVLRGAVRARMIRTWRRRRITRCPSS